MLLGKTAAAIALAGLIGLVGYGQRWLTPAAPLKMVSVDTLLDPTEKAAFAAPKAGTYKLPVIKSAADGPLLTIENKQVTLSAITKGKINLVSFIYVTCNEEQGCPYSMSKLFDVFHLSEKIPGLAKHVNLVTISFDPERDTPEAMAAYGTAALDDQNRNNKLPWHFLTARNKADLRPLLDGFGQTITPRADGKTIDHLLRMYLVDRNGKVRNIYGLGFMDVRLLYADIFTLLLEDGTIEKPKT